MDFRNKKSRNNGYVICSSLENKKASKKVLENGQHWFVAAGRCVSTMPVVAFLNKVYAPILEKMRQKGPQLSVIFSHIIRVVLKIGI